MLSLVVITKNTKLKKEGPSSIIWGYFEGKEGYKAQDHVCMLDFSHMIFYIPYFSSFFIPSKQRIFDTIVVYLYINIIRGFKISNLIPCQIQTTGQDQKKRKYSLGQLTKPSCGKIVRKDALSYHSRTPGQFTPVPGPFTPEQLLTAKDRSFSGHVPLSSKDRPKQIWPKGSFRGYCNIAMTPPIPHTSRVPLCIFLDP